MLSACQRMSGPPGIYAIHEHRAIQHEFSLNAEFGMPIAELRMGKYVFIINTSAQLYIAHLHIYTSAHHSLLKLFTGLANATLIDFGSLVHWCIGLNSNLWNLENLSNEPLSFC